MARVNAAMAKKLALIKILNTCHVLINFLTGHKGDGQRWGTRVDRGREKIILF